MADKSYEEQRREIEQESKQKKRRILLLTGGAMLLVIVAFVVGLTIKPAWVGFFAAGGLILLGFLAKIGGEGLKNANIYEKHRLELLDENTPGGRFNFQ